MVRRGQKAYAAFKDVFTLTGNHRQLNNKNRKRKRDDKQRERVEEFLRRLNKIGNGTCSDADFVYWKQYCLTSQRARNDFTNEPETVTSMFIFYFRVPGKIKPLRSRFSTMFNILTYITNISYVSILGMYKKIG